MCRHSLWVLLALTAAFTPPQPPPARPTVCFGGRPKNKGAKAAQKQKDEAAKEEARASRTYDVMQTRKKESKARRSERLAGRDRRGGTPNEVEKPQKMRRAPFQATAEATAATWTEATAERDGGEKTRPTKVKPVVKKALRVTSSLEAKFLGSWTSPSDMPKEALPEVAFFGRSNVGKSSMLNALVGARRGVAVTGRTPGRTRLLNLFEVDDLAGGRARVVDLPGYGFAQIADAQQADISSFLEAYLDGRTQLRGVVFLVDCRRDPNAEDAELVAVLRSKRIPVVLVATKIDKLKSSAEFAKSLNALEGFYGAEPLFFSSTTRQGRPELWARVNDLLLSENEAEEDVEWVVEDLLVVDDEAPPPADPEDAPPARCPLTDTDLIVF
jgi:GTP-binding protein